MWNVPADIWKHPANRSTRLKSLGRAIRWQLHYRLSGRSMDINYHGMTLRCPPGNHSASRAIYFSGLPDYAEMQFMLDYLRPGDQVIDAGANIGVYTLLALSVVGSGGRVEAIEPNPAVLPWLRDNLRINNALNVTIHYDTVQYDPAEHRIRPDPRPWESPGDNVLVIARCQFEEVSARIGAGVH